MAGLNRNSIEAEQVQVALPKTCMVSAFVIGTWPRWQKGPLPVPVIPPGPPSSFQFVETFKTWHSDGTEFENAFLPPAGGNICFGVWKDLGEGRVKLHHIGLMFAPDGSISNIFTVDETDTVAFNGRTYKGNFAIKLRPPFFEVLSERRRSLSCPKGPRM
jgi:hypothetical protein